MSGEADMGQDLRSYLDRIKREKPDELVIVSKEVDPAYEITALVVKLERERRRRPIIIFERVRGTRFPVITNLHASRSRLAMAMRAAPQEMLGAYLRAMDKPIPPRVVATGPVKDVILTGDRLNLYDLPQIIHHEGDAGPYLTAAISFAKDPASETWNCAYNRLMIKGRDTTSIHLTLGKHLWEFQKIAEARGEPLPVAFAIGVHPAIALGSLAIGSIDEDERAIMGGLFGEPLELVKCETSDVLVPAHAEMVIEGEIRPARAPRRARSASSPAIASASASARCCTSGPSPTARAPCSRTSRWPTSTTCCSARSRWRRTSTARCGRWCRRSRRCACPRPFTCYVSIEQRLIGQAKNAILAVLGADLYMKRVVVVDHDVDIFDDRQMTWAIATRCQPDRDITVITHARGSDLDPSTRRGRLLGQVGRGRDGQALARRLYAAPPRAARRRQATRSQRVRPVTSVPRPGPDSRAASVAA